MKNNIESSPLLPQQGGEQIVPRAVIDAVHWSIAFLYRHAEIGKADVLREAAKLLESMRAAVLPQVGEAKGAVIERLECNVALLKEALTAICNDAEATYNATKSGKSLEISIGQWGRLQRAKTRIGAAPASLGEAKAVAPVTLWWIADDDGVPFAATPYAYEASQWYDQGKTVHRLAAPVAQALPVAEKELTDVDIERGWTDTFSTDNPYCPCNLKSFTKAVRWAVRAMQGEKT